MVSAISNMSLPLSLRARAMIHGSYSTSDVVIVCADKSSRATLGVSGGYAVVRSIAPLRSLYSETTLIAVLAAFAPVSPSDS